VALNPRPGSCSIRRYNTNLVGRQHPSQRPQAPFVNPIRYERLPDLRRSNTVQNGDAAKEFHEPLGKTQLKGLPG
ncbi:hypothetical protein QM008_00140, partial [Bifidobacterium angulatum]